MTLHLLLLGGLDVAASISHIVYSARDSLWAETWCSWLAIPIGGFFALFSGRLFVQHTWMILANCTSKELFLNRRRKERRQNPHYRYGCGQNLAQAFGCRKSYVAHGGSRIGDKVATIYPAVDEPHIGGNKSGQTREINEVRLTEENLVETKVH